MDGQIQENQEGHLLLHSDWIGMWNYHPILFGAPSSLLLHVLDQNLRDPGFVWWLQKSWWTLSDPWRIRICHTTSNLSCPCQCLEFILRMEVLHPWHEIFQRSISTCIPASTCSACGTIYDSQSCSLPPIFNPMFGTVWLSQTFPRSAHALWNCDRFIKLPWCLWISKCFYWFWILCQHDFPLGRINPPQLHWSIQS